MNFLLLNNYLGSFLILLKRGQMDFERDNLVSIVIFHSLSLK